MIVLLPWHCLAGSDAGHDHAARSWRGHRFEGPFPELLKELLFSLLCARHAWLSSGAAPIALQGAEIYIQGWALTGAGWHQPPTTRFGRSGRGKRTMEARTTEPTALGEPVVRVCFAFCPALPACELVQARSVLSPLQCDVQPGGGGVRSLALFCFAASSSSVCLAHADTRTGTKGSNSCQNQHHKRLLVSDGRQGVCLSMEGRLELKRWLTHKGLIGGAEKRIAQTTSQLWVHLQNMGEGKLESNNPNELPLHPWRKGKGW